MKYASRTISHMLGKLCEIDVNDSVSFKNVAVWKEDQNIDLWVELEVEINDKAHKVRFWAAPGQVPYIETKPLHKSQFVVERNEDGSAIFQMEVVLNYELEKDLLGFGEGVKVLSPRLLVHNMSTRLRKASQNYQ